LEKNALISFEEGKKYNFFANNEFVKKTVLDFLHQKFEKPFYIMDYYRYEKAMFFKDYEEGNVDLLTTLIETHINQILLTNEKEEKRLEDNFYNSILYYPEYEVAFAEISLYRGDGNPSFCYLFFADKEKYLAFNKEAKRREKELSEKEIIVFTDTQKGVEQERAKINTLIDRNEVVMEENVKKDIYSTIDQFFKEGKEFYTKYKFPHKRGLLLYGEPGNGKTTLVKSLVSSIDAPVIYWQINEFTTSASIKVVFDKAADLAPVVLVIEDLDSLPQACRSSFLNTLDGATTKEGILLIGTTNYPEKIDKALINRAGRFDRTFEIKLPNEELRSEYLHIRGMGDFISEVEIKDIVEKTENFSYVQLNEIFRRVAFADFNKEEIDINEVIDQIKENNRKTEKATWNTKELTSSLGFN
jgi:SpoVK/Ycf46/Vps4 family AAA+-type ATPase